MSLYFTHKYQGRLLSSMAGPTCPLTQILSIITAWWHLPWPPHLSSTNHQERVSLSPSPLSCRCTHPVPAWQLITLRFPLSLKAWLDFSFLCKPQDLIQCPVQNRCSINILKMNGWMNDLHKLVWGVHIRNCSRDKNLMQNYYYYYIKCKKKSIQQNI